MIRVFDEHGNEVNPTYPKRARGLVKQGRARWADDADDVIVLTSNIEEAAAYPSDVQHKSEDTEMFEYNVNEEIIETAEEAETMEAIEETGLTLKEELNRLYGILENIDKMLYNISAMGVDFSEEMSAMSDESVTAIANAMSDESDRLRHLADRYAEMRAQTITLINKVKDDAKSAEFDEATYIVGQISMTTASYRTMCQHLNDQLRRGVIGLEECREQMAAVQEECDERIRKLRGALNALKLGE